MRRAGEPACCVIWSNLLELVQVNVPNDGLVGQRRARGQNANISAEVLVAAFTEKLFGLQGVDELPSLGQLDGKIQVLRGVDPSGRIERAFLLLRPGAGGQEKQRTNREAEQLFRTCHDVLP